MHGETVVSPLPDSELSFEIFKAIKAVGSIEFFMIFTVTAVNLTVVTRRIRPAPKALKLQFKASWFVVAFWHQTVGEFSAAVCLDALASYSGSA